MENQEVASASVPGSLASPRSGQTQNLVQVQLQRPPSTRTPASSPRRDRDAGLDQGYRRRKTVNLLMLGFAALCAIIALVPLLAIALYVLVHGLSSLDLTFFTHAQSQFDAAGNPLGIGNTIVGTLLLVLFACLVGLPIGLFSGIYLAEYGRGRFATAVRFLADVMAGLPSIVAGLFGYALVVRFLGIGFSVVAGGFALGLLMFPVVTRATEEVLRLVPNSLREGGLALGMPRWRVVANIVVPTAANGIITSILLGIARVTGETAPLLFTSFNNSNWEFNPLRPVGALTYMIFSYTTNQSQDIYYHQAYAGALILIAVVVGLNVAARVLFRQKVRGRI